MENIKKKHLDWIWQNNKEEKEKNMFFLLSSLRPFPFSLLEKIDEFFVDLNCFYFSKKTNVYTIKNHIIEKFLLEYYRQSNLVENFLNLQSNFNFGINQVTFVHLFKYYMFLVFSERRKQKINYSGNSYLFYDEILYSSFQYLQRDKKGFQIHQSAKKYLTEGKTILLTPKQINFKIFDYLILNSNYCYFVAIKNRIRKNLHFILSSHKEQYDNNLLSDTLKSYKDIILQLMIQTQSSGF